MLEEVNDPFEKISQLDLSNGRLATPRKFQQLPHDTRDAVDLRMTMQMLRTLRLSRIGSLLRSGTESMAQRLLGSSITDFPITLEFLDHVIP